MNDLDFVRSEPSNMHRVPFSVSWAFLYRLYCNCAKPCNNLNGDSLQLQTCRDFIAGRGGVRTEKLVADNMKRTQTEQEVVCNRLV